jgi:predicted mannosyl-3-phosphoglycerate phosphatase (HAD superfamily)
VLVKGLTKEIAKLQQELESLKKEHFQSKVFWSVIAYNIRVMTGLVIAKIA